MLNKQLLERYYLRDEEVFLIYRVNGPHVTNQIDNDFIRFGYNSRFPFIPSNEIWIADFFYDETIYSLMRAEIFAERELVTRGYTYEVARHILSSTVPTGINGNVGAFDSLGRLADSDYPVFHASEHQVGGRDEINVDALSGLLADQQSAGWLRWRKIVDPLNPSENEILKWDSTNSIYDTRYTGYHEFFRIGWSLGAAPSGTSNVAGVREQVVTAQTVDGVTSPAVNNINRAQLLINITTLTTAGTLRITGDSYDPTTEATTVGDTEDIVIDSTGWYESSKHWEEDTVVSSVSGLDAVFDAYRWMNYITSNNLFDNNLEFRGVRFSAFVTNAAASIQLQMYRFDKLDKTFTSFFNQTLTPPAGPVNTTLFTARLWDAGDIELNALDGDGLLVQITSTNIREIQIEMRFRNI